MQYGECCEPNMYCGHIITALWPQESGRFIHSCFSWSLIINQHIPGTKKVRTQVYTRTFTNVFFGGNFQICHEVSGISVRNYWKSTVESTTKSLKSIPSGSGPRVGGEGRQGRICKELQVFLMWSMYGDGIWLQAHFLIRKKKSGGGHSFRCVREEGDVFLNDVGWLGDLGLCTRCMCGTNYLGSTWKNTNTSGGLRLN